MSDFNEHDKQSGAEQAPPRGVDASVAHGTVQQRRRRLLKLGAGAVPVSLTLASRPVMAWHCNTTSAWGSAQGVNPLSSVAVRTQNHQLADECYSVTAWRASGASGQAGYAAWTALKGATSVGTSGSNCQGKYTMNQLFNTAAGGKLPLGLTDKGTSKVYAVLISSSCASGSFQEAIVVAMLNYLTNAAVRSCLNPNNTGLVGGELANMVGGSYTVPNTKTVWDQTQIKDYLVKNWMASA